MGILVPPAIFMIVIGTMTNTSIVGIFLGGFIPALAMSAILMAVIYWQARRFNWPTDARPSWRGFLKALKGALLPLFVPFVMLVGFRFGIFTATEAGAIIAFYAVIIALLVYRNVTVKEMLKVAEESALVSAAVVLLMGVATVYQFLMGMAQVPQWIGHMLTPLQGSPWAFLCVVALIVGFFGMVMEGLPAAVILVPVLFPAAKAMGVQPIHFNIVLTAAVGWGCLLVPGIRVFGGLVLNFPVGGLNPFAVDSYVRLGAKEVWMPSLSAEYTLSYQKAHVPLADRIAFNRAHGGDSIPPSLKFEPGDPWPWSKNGRGISILDEAGNLCRRCGPSWKSWPRRG